MPEVLGELAVDMAADAPAEVLCVDYEFHVGNPFGSCGGWCARKQNTIHRSDEKSTGERPKSIGTA